MEHRALAERVLQAARQIVRRTTEYSRKVSSASGLTVPQVLCLRAIANADPAREMTVAQVSQNVQLAPATVSRILDRLEMAGLVIRERRSQDRRRVCLALTPAGQERIQNLPSPLGEEFLNRLFALPPEEQTRLLSALEQLSQMMGKGEKGLPPEEVQLLEADLTLENLFPEEA